MPKKVLVIGAGPAGMIAGAYAAKNGAEVIILERNEKPGRKLAITGKGRCNVTNNCLLLNDLIAAVPVNGRFLYGAFSRFMPGDTMELFESLGVPLKVERGNRVFPVSDNAFDIVDALDSFASSNGVRRVCARAESLVIKDGAVCGVNAEGGGSFSCDAVIIATGGASYPVTGSTGDGYKLAKQAGHTVIKPKPSLVPLECHEGFCSELSGLSLRNVAIRVIDNDKYREIYSDFGEMLFTHFGVSGPIILSASSHMREMKEGKYTISIDLKPALDAEQLDKRLVRELTDNSNKTLYNTIATLLPRSLVPVFVKRSGIPGTVKSNQITKDERTVIGELLKDFRVTVTDYRPLEEAVVTSGGVDIKEIDPKTMKSKITDGLYFAGEVMDVDAYTGGFNLQIAFSTGVLAGNSI